MPRRQLNYINLAWFVGNIIKLASIELDVFEILLGDNQININFNNGKVVLVDKEFLIVDIKPKRCLKSLKGCVDLTPIRISEQSLSFVSRYQLGHCPVSCSGCNIYLFIFIILCYFPLFSFF